MNYTLEELQEAVKQELIAQGFPGLANHTVLPQTVCKIAHKLYNPVKADTEITEEQVIANYKEAQKAESKAEDALFDYFRPKFEEVKGNEKELEKVRLRMPDSYASMLLFIEFIKPLQDKQLDS